MELQLIGFVTLLVVNFALGTKDIAREKKEITYKASYLKTEQGLAQNLPVCADSEDSRFCNCFAQKSIGHCESKRNDMQYWCPITCKLCTGLPKEDVGKVIVARRAPSPPRCQYTKHGCCKDGTSVALGPHRAGCPENCYDEPRFFCSFYQIQKLCTGAFYTSLLHRCPRTCGFCSPPEKVNKCEDKWGDKMCQYFDKFKMCTRRNHKHKMARNCRKTCNKCTLPVPQLKHVAPQCVQDGNCCWDKRTPVSHGCPKCRNLMNNRFCDLNYKSCNKVFHIKGNRIRELCPRTCGLCVKTRQCKDDVLYKLYCHTWKKEGKCESERNIMKMYCPRTCDMCEEIVTEAMSGKTVPQ